MGPTPTRTAARHQGDHDRQQNRDRNRRRIRDHDMWQIHDRDRHGFTINDGFVIMIGRRFCDHNRDPRQNRDRDPR